MYLPYATSSDYWSKSYETQKYSLREKCPYFPAFRLNTERYSISLRIQSEREKMQIRITPNTDFITQWLIPQNNRQSAFFGFPDNKKNLEIINHFHFIFKYYSFKSRDTRKITREGLQKNIIQNYNIEKQICCNDSKKRNKFKKKWHILTYYDK